MEDVTRRRTLRFLCSTNVVQYVIGTVLLGLGIFSRSNHGSYRPGVPPYYTGAFICMTTIVLQANLGFIIFYRGKKCVNKNDVAKKIGCWMQTYSLISAINGIGQIASMLIVGFTGVCTSGHCSYLENEGENEDLAISILVFSVLAMISSAIGLFVVRVYSSYYGFKMLARGQYQISVLDSQNVTNIEQTPVVNITSGPTQTIVNSHHSHNTHHLNSHPDPRLEFPTADFSAHHVTHYLTQQYRERIRKRKKKTKKTMNENYSNNGRRNGRQHRSAPYELPPLSTLSQRFPQPPSPPRMQPPDSPSPPLAPTLYPPPSPPSTPPLVSPSSIPIPEITTTSASPPPWSLTPSPPPPPPSPPMDYLGIVHVIPCGEYTDDDSSLYSCV